jgi:type I restriction enzyme M protein
LLPLISSGPTAIFGRTSTPSRFIDPDHIEFLGNIIRLRRGEAVETDAGSGARMAEHFPEGKYREVLGLCR